MKSKEKIIYGVAILSLLSFLPSVQALALSGPWGPERKTFTWDAPAAYATFNSMTNNPDLGDERNFVRIRQVGDAKFGDSVDLKTGKTYEVYMYYHNNASPTIGKTAVGIADNVRMSANFPAQIKAGEKLAVNAIISAADTNPLSVWDGAYINADSDFYLRYVPGSATYHNGGALNGQPVGPDYLFSDEGVLLGYDKAIGLLPGCNQYAGFVTYQFVADRPEFDINKTVLDGKGVYVDNVVASSGDMVTFRVRYENKGTMIQQNVVVKDTLPDGLEYIKGSSSLKNNSDTGGSKVSDNIITASGLNIGNYAGGDGWAEVSYQAKIKSGLACDKKLTNMVSVITADGTKEDSATVSVGGNCTPAELPKSGPAEIVLAVVAALSVGVGGTYWYRSRRVLMSTEKTISGETLDKSN
mgnify:CR=1 FL=1